MPESRIEKTDRAMSGASGVDEFPAYVSAAVDSHGHLGRKRAIPAAARDLTTRATKRKLRVEIYDKLERASLSLHDQGGRKLPRGQTLAIPNRPIAARRGSKGVPKGLRPRALSRSFATKWKTGDTLIFQQTGSYRKAGPPNKAGKRRPAKDNRHLKLAYVLKSSVPVKADVPFHADFERVMRRQMPTQFGVAMVAAVNTSLRK